MPGLQIRRINTGNRCLAADSEVSKDYSGVSCLTYPIAECGCTVVYEDCCTSTFTGNRRIRRCTTRYFCPPCGERQYNSLYYSMRSSVPYHKNVTIPHDPYNEREEQLPAETCSAGKNREERLTLLKSRTPNGNSPTCPTTQHKTYVLGSVHPMQFQQGRLREHGEVLPGDTSLDSSCSVVRQCVASPRQVSPLKFPLDSRVDHPSNPAIIEHIDELKPTHKGTAPKPDTRCSIHVDTPTLLSYCESDAAESLEEPATLNCPSRESIPSDSTPDSGTETLCHAVRENFRRYGVVLRELCKHLEEKKNNGSTIESVPLRLPPKVDSARQRCINFYSNKKESRSISTMRNFSFPQRFRIRRHLHIRHLRVFLQPTSLLRRRKRLSVKRRSVYLFTRRSSPLNRTTIAVAASPPPPERSPVPLQPPSPVHQSSSVPSRVRQRTGHVVAVEYQPPILKDKAVSVHIKGVGGRSSPYFVTGKMERLLASVKR